uniref:Uncharacterized protein n=1 Tax=Strongyloides venezuelensis TaxID=75913 RepID=A0A0K0FLK8_STRVS
MPNLKPAKEDSWAFQTIGSPFPDAPVKVIGQQNQYVALWYKNGKPIHGRAWNNGGVVECSFPYLKTELKGAHDLGGQIQILQYKGNHLSLGYWYNWIKYSDRFDIDNREILRCGDSIPILWKNRPNGAILGYLDNKTEIAKFSHDGVCEEIVGPKLSDFLIIVRELKGSPPGCECKECAVKPPPPPTLRVNSNVWRDYRIGDSFPTDGTPLKALGKSLATVDGESVDQYVALWYQQGEPVYGRVWNENGKIAGSFAWHGNDYRKNLGSIQILFELPEAMRGYDYLWVPYPEACASARNPDAPAQPVHVKFAKGDITPAALCMDGGKQILGKADMMNERTEAGFGGKGFIQEAKNVHTCLVLCRKAKPGCKLEDDA